MNQKLPNPHPGEILLQDFLKPMNLSAYQLSHATDIPQSGISAIVHGRRSITADTALRLSKYFGNTAKFWLGLQMDYDIEEATKVLHLQLERIKKFQSVSGKNPEGKLKRHTNKSMLYASINQKETRTEPAIKTNKGLKAYFSDSREGTANLVEEPKLQESVKRSQKKSPNLKK